MRNVALSVRVVVVLSLLLSSFVLPTIDSSDALTNKISAVIVEYFKPSQVSTAATMKIKIDINENLPIHSWIKIIFPDDWTMPDVPNVAKWKQVPEHWDKELERVLTSIYITTSPCTKCQGLPIVKTNKRKNQELIEKCGIDDENSIQFWTHLELSPDGPYDPIPITVASRAGFLNSETPGAYQICIETESEPIEVCSNDIFVVKSHVEPADVTLSNNSIDQNSSYNLKFRVGEGGSLDARRSRITLKFPDETIIPEYIEPSTIKVNGLPVSVDISTSPASYRLSFITPVDIENNGQVTVNISEKAGIINTSVPGEYSVDVFTNYEPDVVPSKKFTISRVGQKPIVIPPYAGQYASYKFSVFIPSPINQNDLITVEFPSGTELPSYMSGDKVLMDGNPCQLKPRVLPEENKIQLYAPAAYERGSIMLQFLEGTKIRNPGKPGTYKIYFTVQSSDETFESDEYDILEKLLTIDSVIVKPVNAKENASWTLEGSLEFNGGLEPGDTMTLTFPETTVVPDVISATDITFNGKPVRDVMSKENSITLTIPVKVELAGAFKIVITQDAGIENPSVSSTTHKILIKTSKSSKDGESVEFFIAPAKPVTTLAIRPSEPDGKNGWYVNAPEIDLVCPTKTATVYTWWNHKKESMKEWDPGWNRIADQQRIDTIYYYAEDTYGTEEIQSHIFKIDTLSPTFTISSPVGGSSAKTQDSKFIIKGTADATEMLVYDDPEQSSNVVPTITINGEIIDVIRPPEVGLDVIPEGIGDFELEVNLKEGENKFLIRAEDEAGNFVEKEVIITKDTIAPTIEITSPKPGETNHCDFIEVHGITEPGAIVTMNDDFVDVSADGTFIYDYTVLDPKQIEHVITYDVADDIGNKTQKMTYTIYYGTIAVIPTGGDQPSINGQAPTEDSAGYVSTSGKTMVPFRYLADGLMGAVVGYDATTRTASITATDGSYKIVHKIGTTYFDKTIAGKTTRVDIPAPSEIKNGRTYLPMREFIEGALGLEVQWDPATRTVTVPNYAKPELCK